MPSQSYRAFKKNIIDVHRLIRDYHTLSEGYYSGKGRRALDHITRSGVILLAGAWEVYIEDVIAESARHFLSVNTQKIPKKVKQEVSKYVRNNKDETKAFALAGEGWKQIYMEEVVLPQTRNLHTPKPPQVNDLFNRLLGIQEISQHWTNPSFIEEFMVSRGALAHGDKSGEYLKVAQLAEYLEVIISTVKEIDLFLIEYLKGFTGNQPWKRVY